MIAQTSLDWLYGSYLLLLAGTLVALSMSFYIVFQAYRGYRRNASERMLYLAVGLAMVTVAPFGLSLLVTGLGQQLGFGSRVYTFYLPFFSRVFQVVGLGSIIYSLHRGG